MNTFGTTLLITLTGRDRPGVTSRLFGALARYQLSVVDIEQVVIRGKLVLGVLLECDGPPDLTGIHAAVSALAAAWIPVRSGGPSHSSRTPRTSLPRITTCSISTTDSWYRARAPNSLEVTPGRSRPVRVMSSVVPKVFMAAPGYRKSPGSRRPAPAAYLTQLTIPR